MNDLIINPIWIYLMGISEGVICALIGLSIISLLCLIGTAVHSWDLTDDALRKCKVWIKIFVSSLLIFTLFAAIIPPKNTILKMMIAKNLTYTKVNTILNQGKILKDEFKNDIIDILGYKYENEGD